MPVTHKIVFTPTGDSAVTLADLADGDGYKIERLPGEAAVETAEMFQAAEAVQIPLGNVKGSASLRCWQQFDNPGAAAADFKIKRALLNKQGALVITYSGTALSMANAVCKSVEPSLIVGLRWELSYVFEINSIT